MKLLPEYALLHEVFTSRTEEKFQLAYFRDVIFRDGVVRDLRDGAWFRTLQRIDHLSQLAREIIEALAKTNRLIAFRACRPSLPLTEREWCIEALATHRDTELKAIICGRNTADSFNRQWPVVAIDDLPQSVLTQHTESVRLPFCIEDYIANLDLVLEAARRICFIDPYIDPKHRDYRDFPRLLLHAKGRTPAPRIELHRKCFYKRPGDREQPHTKADFWKEIFDDWSHELARAGVSAKVMIWDEFKTRYFLSELIGLQIAKGFKCNTDPRNFNDWSRLSRQDREDVDREFDENGPNHHLWCTVEIGAGAS